MSFQRISQLLKEPVAPVPAIVSPNLRALLRSVRNASPANRAAWEAAWRIGAGGVLRALTDRRDDSLNVDDILYVNRRESVA